MGLKALAWYVTGSVALLSDALESTVNVIAAAIAYGVISYAQKPADDDHQFGHHKAEYLSAVVEGMLIIVAAIPDRVGSGGASLQARTDGRTSAWPRHQRRGGCHQCRLGLAADQGRHAASFAGAEGGRAACAFRRCHIRRRHRRPDRGDLEGYTILDPLMAIGVAINILFEGWKVVSQSVNGLLDRAVTAEEDEAIKKAIAENATGSLGVHDLRNRRAGPAVFIDFHLVVPETMPVGQAHDICDRIENALHQVISGASIAIHVEPEGEKPHGVRVNLAAHKPMKKRV